MTKGKREYTCSKCDKVYNTTKSNFNSHVKRCENKADKVETGYKCTQCEYQTNNKSNLNKHNRRVHIGLKDSINDDKNIIVKIAGIKGKINRYSGRVKSKDADIRDDAIKKLDIAKREHEKLTKLYKTYFVENEPKPRANVKKTTCEKKDINTPIKQLSKDEIINIVKLKGKLKKVKMHNDEQGIKEATQDLNNYLKSLK
jgi:hypothetical protein